MFIYQKAEDLLENPKSDNKPSFNSESHPEVVVQPVAPKQKVLSKTLQMSGVILNLTKIYPIIHLF